MATVASAPHPADQSRPKQSPATSALSSHSLGDNATFSLPPSSLASGESSGSEQSPSAGEVTRSESQKKKPISQRLTRMFSSKNTADAALAAAVSPPSNHTSPTDQPARNPSVVAATSGKGELRPAAPRRDRSSSNGSSKKSFLSAGNSSDKLNAAERKDLKASAKNEEKNGTGPVSRRFIMKDDGTHEHFLKAEKRQEKLTDMFRSLLSGRKKDGEPQEHQLSLMSSWVDQVKSEKAAPDQKGGPNTAASLVDKYGKCQEIVGRGAFGIVRISHKTDRADPKKEQLYAVKEFRRRPSESSKKYNKRLTSEFCISSALRHPNVIHTLDLLKDAKGDYCEVMEYCAGGDLYTLVLAAGKLEVVEADCYFKQLMRGVEYIHEMGVAHRDLKPENLLLTTHGSLKITDFGNGECFRMAWEQEPHMVAGLCGSAPYIAPEEYVDSEFDPRAVDVWACGVIYMAMRTGRHLWRVAQKEEDEFYRKYLQGRRDEDGYGPIETLHRARCRNVIYSILDPNPARRITASQILRSEWGREIKLCKAGEEGF